MLRLAAAFFLLPALCTAQAAMSFDDSPADRIVLSSASYEVALSKTNGAILYLLDKSTGGHVSTGSRGGCLWGSLTQYPGPNPSYIGGCSYSSTGKARFSYSWDSVARVLAFSYLHDPAVSQYLDATVTLMATASAYFDLSLTLQNHLGKPIGEALFPSDLSFSTGTVQGVYLPMQLPGIRLKPSWFNAGKNFVVNYPGKENFADYLALDSTLGRLAFYSVDPQGPVQPVASGLFHYAGDPADQYVFTHNFQLWVPDGDTFTSPAVRIWLGRGPRDTAVAYRNDNGIDRYPTISTKLGARFSQVAQSPLVKTEFAELGLTFRALSTQLSTLSAPALIHPVSYWPLGFDRDYPDFLPPNSAYGTTEDYAAFVAAAHAGGFLVMPYTNPTWWKPESPTVRNLLPPLTAADLAVQDQAGQPLSETYNPADGPGMPVAPSHPFVRKRLEQLRAGWRTSVPVDFVFSDQIGARPWEFDFNPSEPNPTAFSAGWQDWFETYPLQGTEDGWDRLAATAFGFFGSPLTAATSFSYAAQRYGIASNGNNRLGPGNWDPYPLATWMFHDKVFFYQHDLDERTTTAVDEVITWNLAFGNMLNYRWPSQQAASRVALGNQLHRIIVPYYAGQVLSSYSELQTDVTASVFGNLTVIANWQQTKSYTTADGYSILPGGYFARTSDGTASAGVFTGSFNGAPLSAGEHHILTSVAANAISVFHPVGTDTSLTVSLPSPWSASDGIVVKAVDRAKASLGVITGTVASGKITFSCTSMVGPGQVDHYEITRAARRPGPLPRH